MMFQSAGLLRPTIKQYGLGKDLDVLKRIYFLSVFSPELDVKERYQSIFTEELRSRWKKEMDAASLDAGQDEEVRALRLCLKRIPSSASTGRPRWCSGGSRRTG